MGIIEKLRSWARSGPPAPEAPEIRPPAPPLTRSGPPCEEEKRFVELMRQNGESPSIASTRVDAILLKGGSFSDAIRQEERVLNLRTKPEDFIRPPKGLEAVSEGDALRWAHELAQATRIPAHVAMQWDDRISAVAPNAEGLSRVVTRIYAEAMTGAYSDLSGMSPSQKHAFVFAAGVEAGLGPKDSMALAGKVRDQYFPMASALAYIQQRRGEVDQFQSYD